MCPYLIFLSFPQLIMILISQGHVTVPYFRISDNSTSDFVT